jgi:hypothetical protein
VALGTPGPMPANGASDPLAMEFWRQLTFIRMFSAAMIGVGAICIWGRARLTPTQQTSFLKVLVGVFALLFDMALSQQTAIWGARVGWVLVVVLGAAALACLSALIDNAVGRHQGTLRLGLLALVFASVFMLALAGALGTRNLYYVGAAAFSSLGCVVMAPPLFRSVLSPRRPAV